MRVGFMSEYDPERIAFAKANGFGSVELMVNETTDFLPGCDGWQSKAKQMAAAYAEAGIRISCIAGFYMNHLGGDDAERARGHDAVRKAITLAKTIGVGVVAGFAGRIMHRPLEESLPEFKKVWSEHAACAEDHGVKIAFENCPMGRYHTPAGGNNMMCTPAIWRRGFEAVGSDALGLEWDPSHLIGLRIDPVSSLREFGSRIFHVHAKDAKINHDILLREGFWSSGAVEHCFAGMGDTDWAACIKELLRQGYTGDLNIEGWHDAVYREAREDQGLLISRRYLSKFL